MKYIFLWCLFCFAGLAQAQIIDLTYAFDESTLYWPTAEPFEKRTVSEGHTEGGYYYSAYWIATAEHGGTHLDAPVHFYEGRETTDEIPLSRLIGDAVLIDVTTTDPNALISVSALKTWEAENGIIANNTIILLQTGWGRYWPEAKRYLGTDERGTAAVAKLRFPGLSKAAANWLVNERQIAAIGIDTASIDRGQSTDFQAHRVLAEASVPIFENVANLDQLLINRFKVIALPMKLKGGSGGPLRIVAVLGE